VTSTPFSAENTLNVQIKGGQRQNC